MRSLLAVAATVVFCAGCATDAPQAATATSGTDAKDARRITGSHIPREATGAETVKTIAPDSYELSRTIGSNPPLAGQRGRAGN